MVDDTTNDGGFLFKLLTESHYRSMLFAASDNIDSTVHPKLVVNYTGVITTGLDKELAPEVSFKLYPNPSVEGIVSLSTLNFNGLKQLHITDIIGNTLVNRSFTNEDINISVSDYPKGIYFVSINDGTSKITKKLIKH